MKRLAIFAMLAGLCCFTIGCAKTADTAGDAADATVNAVDEAADATMDAAEDAGDAVSEAADDAVDAADDAFGTE